MKMQSCCSFFVPLLYATGYYYHWGAEYCGSICSNVLPAFLQHGQLGLLCTVCCFNSKLQVAAYLSLVLFSVKWSLSCVQRRPTFRFHSWHTALLGFVCSVAIMFFINPLAAGLAIGMHCLVLCRILKSSICLGFEGAGILLFVMVSVIGPATHWGEVAQGLIYHQACHLLLLKKDNLMIALCVTGQEILTSVRHPKTPRKIVETTGNVDSS